MKNIKKMSGFTLVELLIVIVIIGILATIGFVAFSGAQNAAKKSDAESTLSQVKSALGVYAATDVADGGGGGEYPDDKAAVKTWLESTAGGNNDALSTKIGGATDGTKFVYAQTDSGAGFTFTAKGSIWGGTDGAAPTGEDVTVTN